MNESNLRSYSREINVVIITSKSRSIKSQTTNISNICHGNTTISEQSSDNSNLDFKVIRDITFEVVIPLTTTLKGDKKVYHNNYCNTIQTPVQSNTAVNYSDTISGKNASHLSQPSIKYKTNHMGKRNLFIVGNSYIKQVKKI